MNYVPGDQNSFGASLGRGISQGIQDLTERRMKDVQRKHQSQGLRSFLPGLSAEDADFLVLLPEKDREPILKQLLAEPGNKAFASANSALRNNYFGNGQQQQPMQGSMPLGVSENINGINEPAGQIERQGSALVPGMDQQQQGVQQTMTPPQAQQPNIDYSKISPERQQQLASNERAYEDLRIKQEANKIKAEAAEKKDLNQVEQRRLARFTPHIDKVKAKFENRQNTFKQASEALDLLNSGKVPTGFLGEWVTGGNLEKFAANPAAQEYNRLLNDLVLSTIGEQKGATSEYKARLIADAKTNIGKTLDAQKAFLEKKRDSQINGISENYAIEDLEYKYGSKLPEDFHKQVKDQMALYKKLPLDLPNANEFSEDAEAKVNGIKIAPRGGRWAVVGKVK